MLRRRCLPMAQPSAVGATRGVVEAVREVGEGPAGEQVLRRDAAAVMGEAAVRARLAESRGQSPPGVEAAVRAEW